MRQTRKKSAWKYSTSLSWSALAEYLVQRMFTPFVSGLCKNWAIKVQPSCKWLDTFCICVDRFDIITFLFVYCLYKQGKSQLNFVHLCLVKLKSLVGFRKNEKQEILSMCMITSYGHFELRWTFHPPPSQQFVFPSTFIVPRSDWNHTAKQLNEPNPAHWKIWQK